LSTYENDSYVLFTVEAEDLFSYQVVHVTGNAKLIELPIEEKHVPNIYLRALLVSDAEVYHDSKEVVVPPVQQFLTIDVKSDREQYQPREEGTLSISAKDVNGKPVAAEIAVGLVDESVKYIQQDYAGDPRQFYYGTKRSESIQTQTTFDQKSYLRLVEVTKGKLVDIKDVKRDGDDSETEAAAGAGGAGGGGARNEAVDTLSTFKAEFGKSVQTRAVKELPVNGRTLQNFALLSPAVGG